MTYNALPNSVLFCECACRDGLQNLKDFVPTDKKIALINRFVEIGFKKIEVTSFSHPKYLPQFADSEQVLRGIARKPGVHFVAVVPNMKGMERCLQMTDAGYGVDEIIVVASASEAHNRANLNRTPSETIADLEGVVKAAKNAGIWVIGSVLTSFGCAISGDVPFELVVERTRQFLDIGCDEIQLGDTTGEANPVQTYRYFTRIRELFPRVNFIAHFHDTRGTGLANAVAALQAGATSHDTSIGGIGGQPATGAPLYHVGATGNSVTEDMVCMFNEMGIVTGVKSEDIVATARLAEELLGQTLRGWVTRAGPVRHKPTSYPLPTR